MKWSVSQFLHFAGAATAFFASPYVVRGAGTGARWRATDPFAQDRLEEHLLRVADPNGEGSRACLRRMPQAARAAADAADARARINRTSVRSMVPSSPSKLPVRCRW